MSTTEPPKFQFVSQFYAHTQGCKTEGKEECHWCSAPCLELWIHDDPPPMIGAKRSIAKRPSRQYICLGCWLFRRKRVTVKFLSGKLTDGKCLSNYSLLINSDGAFAIDHKEDKESIYKKLLSPDPYFVLALLDGTGNTNHIQLMHFNDLHNGKADTPIHFTINNIPHTYNVYELTEAIKSGEVDGKSPGVAALIRLFGEYKLEEVKKPVGRPAKEHGKPTDKPILSGAKK